MRLTLIISSLTSGGAERAVVLLAEGFLKKGYQVTVLTLDNQQNDFYQLPNEVQRLALSITGYSQTLVHAIVNNIKRIRVLRKVILQQNSDIVISFLDTTNIVTMLALTGTKYPVLLSEQNNPCTNSKGRIWDNLRFLTYPKAAKVISTSQGVDSYFNWLPKSKRAVIYNPLATVEDGSNTVDLPQGADPEKKWIIAMGRLTYQKGFDILLPAFHQIINKYPNWQLIILGEGQLRSELEHLKDDLGLSHQVILPGVIKNPFPLLKKSHIFVLSSRFEGFGNVLIEAMACGLPVISTDCPSGPREIIRDGIDGILVPNEDISALASAMDRLMCDEKERQRLAAHAPEGVTRFSLEKIVEMWEVVFTEVLQKKAK
jgi:GalNAc-alpha-(1->4)-GalNAc-alpha-(1->3)-diNAcBac-PP-undecaprenol alpha-1,4-N-acetyl-D-galactosaminyltransferase